MSIDLSRGYTSIWRVVSVNPYSWDDGAALTTVTSIDISKDATDDTPMLETGSMSLTLDNDEEFEAGWYRIEMLAIQGDEHELYQLATLYFQASSSTRHYQYQEISASGESVLKPASDKTFVIGSYAPKGTDIVEYIGDLLREVCVAPVDTEGSASIQHDIVYDANTSYLSAIWTLLDAIKYVIQIDGDGTIHVVPKPSQIERVISSASANSLEDGIDDSLDISDVPNVVTVYDEGRYFTVRNEDPDSDSSIQSRGFEKTYFEDNPNMETGDTLESYANTLLETKSTVMREYSYTREFDPMDDGFESPPFSMVRATLSNIGFSGDLRITKQDWTCGNGIKIKETACEEVKLWTRTT